MTKKSENAVSAMMAPTTYRRTYLLWANHPAKMTAARP